MRFFYNSSIGSFHFLVFVAAVVVVAAAVVVNKKEVNPIKLFTS